MTAGAAFVVLAVVVVVVVVDDAVVVVGATVGANLVGLLLNWGPEEAGGVGEDLKVLLGFRWLVMGGLKIQDDDVI